MSLRPLFVAIAVLVGPAVAAGATITVTTTAQQAAPGEGCTISDAILTANAGLPIGDCTIESGGDGLVIRIPAGTYVLTTGTANADESLSAFPLITVPITIEGAVLPDGSRPIITRDANAPAFRIFRTEASLTFRHLTLSGGDAGTNCCGARQPGGAIYAWGQGLTVAIDDVIFENNTAGHGGAIADANAVYSSVRFAITGSTFRGNHADLGGAIRVTGSGLLSIRDSHFENNTAVEGGAINSDTNGSTEIEGTQFIGNQATQNGGAVTAAFLHLTRVTMWQNTAGNGGGAVHLYADWYHFTPGVATVVDSSFANNGAQHGGALHIVGIGEIRGSTFVNNVATGQNGGAVEFGAETLPGLLSNSTFSGNQAVDRGGAVYLYGGTLSINNVTITGNSSSQYGPGLALGWWGGSTVEIANSIVAGNITTWGSEIDVLVDPNEHLTSLGYNIIGTDRMTRGGFTGPGDRIGTEESPLDPGLEDLADNGGPTQTRALAPGSLALDAGNTATPGSEGACETVDQRGMQRPGAGTAACDIGAFEQVITFPLTVHVGAGGSVVGLNGSSACIHDDCVGEFDSGTTVKLEAQAADGHTFVGWLGGGCSAAPVCFVMMDSAKTVTATFHTESAATTTTLTSSPNPSAGGQLVTFTANVESTEPAAGHPSGSVEFLNVTAGTVLGFATLNNAGTASLSVPLPIGTYEIRAIYTGDGTFTASSGTHSQSVLLGSTTVLTSSPNPVDSGDLLRITATVSASISGGPTPTGSVSFIHVPTNIILGTEALNAFGVVTLTTAGLPEGIYDLQAIYNGNSVFTGSTATITQTISPYYWSAIRNGVPEARAQFDAVGMILPAPGHAACTGTLISPFVVLTAAHCVRDDSPNPIFEFSLGADRIARVTDIRVHPWYETPDGNNLTFDLALLSLDRTAASWTDIVPATLRAGTPNLQVEATAIGFGETMVGSRSGRRTSGTVIVEDYIPGEGPSGVINPQAFLEVIPGSADQMFCPAGSGGPLFFEDQIVGVASFRFVATCAEAGPGYYVTFDHAADWIQTTTAELEAASEERGTSTIELTSSANPVVSGQPLTIRAKVTAPDSSNHTPTGSVEFEDTTANVSLGSATLDAEGVATISPSLPVGTHTIVAHYDGDDFVGPGSLSIEQETLPTTVDLDVSEIIMVDDGVGLLPSQMLSVDESIIVTDTVTPLPSAMLSVDEAIVVTDTVTPLKSAMLNVDETVIVSDAVNPEPQSNTPVGTNVAIRFDPVTVTLFFASVSRAGATTVTAVDPISIAPPPTGFDQTTPPTTFEISTTAGFSGAINVCMSYPAGSVSPRAMHFEGGAWIDRTVSTNIATRSVCASVTSLSPFAVFVPQALEGRMTGDGELAGGHEFNFRVAEKSLGDERGALIFKRKTPKSGKQKETTDQFRATSIGDITFWDDPAYRGSKRSRPAVDSVVFTGTGKWNGVAGYSFEVEAADEGEPGRGRDTFTIVIRNPLGAIVASSNGVLTAGNIQSQRVPKR